MSKSFNLHLELVEPLGSPNELPLVSTRGKEKNDILATNQLGMAFLKVYINFVWSTKNREPYLHNLNLRKKMWKHIREVAMENRIHIDFISGYTDHCHCLISMGPEQSLAGIMQQLKGESARWINEQQILEKWFEWQDAYYAASVSESMLYQTREYIKNQEKHHQSTSFNEECVELMGKYAFRKFPSHPPLESGGNS